MASVKYAISAYVADGTTTDYLITWDYLDEDHIAVYVDGTSNADPTASHTFSKLNDTTLRITDELGNAIAAGAEIEIRRETPLTTRAITFADGSALLASDLNKNSDYLLYSMQEVLDTVDAAAQDGALAAQVATEEFRDQAEVHKNNALAAQTAAETARNTTQGYLATVQSDATDADNHRIAAAASETAAAASQAAAATSETNSATSATASAASAAASAASETAAAASETAAAASETAAAASETAAAASEAAAATSEANAAASFDNFDDRYLGAKATAPTVDNDGDALLTGALYWNNVSDEMYVWNGTTWDTFNSTQGISDSATSSKVYINNSRVGVGVSSPAEALHVQDSTAATDTQGIRVSTYRPHVTLEDMSVGQDDWQIWADSGWFSLRSGDITAADKLPTEKLAMYTTGELFVNGREQFNFANAGDITSANNYNSITPNSVFYAQGAVGNHHSSYNGMGMYLSTRGLGTTHDDVNNERAAQIHFPDIDTEHGYYRVRQGTSGWHSWKPMSSEWAALEGPTSYYGSYQTNWQTAFSSGHSLSASTSNRGITVNKSGQYYCFSWQRSTGGDMYIGLGINGNRQALENRSSGAWGHDHSAVSQVWAKSVYIGYLGSGEKVTSGPPTNSGNVSYATSGHTGGLIIFRLS